MEKVMSINVGMICANVTREGNEYVLSSTTHEITKRFPAHVNKETLRIACTMFLKGYSQGLAAN